MPSCNNVFTPDLELLQRCWRKFQSSGTWLHVKIGYNQPIFRRKLLLSFVTSPMPQNSGCIYAECGCVATVHLKHTQQRAVWAERWTVQLLFMMASPQLNSQGSQNTYLNKISKFAYMKSLLLLLIPPPPPPSNSSMFWIAQSIRLGNGVLTYQRSQGDVDEQNSRPPAQNKIQGLKNTNHDTKHHGTHNIQ